MTPQTLLIVGAGVFQTYAISVAKNMGLKVCVLDNNPNAPGIKMADDFQQASTRHIDEAINAAKLFHKKYRLNGVFTCGTDVSYTVAKIAQAIGLPGIPPETALKATNKGVMRETLFSAGIFVPRFKIIEELNQALECATTLGFPLVIKPVDNMGARGVRKLSSMKELKLFWHESIRHSITERVIIEQYFPGKELSIDTITFKGQTHLITIADRIIKGSPYFIEKGHTIPSKATKKEQEEAFTMAKKAIKALDIPFGPAKFDMKISPFGPVICEMTARLSGGFHCQVTEPLATGMNSIKAAIDLCLGKDLDLKDITPKFNYAAAERSIYPKPGKVVSIRGIEKSRNLKNIATVVLNVKPGDILLPLTSNIGKAGHVIGFGKTRKEAVRNTLRAVKAIDIKTTPIKGNR